MTSFSTDLLAGVAQMLDDAGIATYNETGVYTAGQVGVFFSVMPDQPDRCVVLEDYGVSDQIEQAMSTRGIQFRVRGDADPFPVKQMRDAIFVLFHNATRFALGSVYVDQMYQHSSIALGRDQANRWIESLNFYADLDLPATVNRPY